MYNNCLPLKIGTYISKLYNICTLAMYFVLILPNVSNHKLFGNTLVYLTIYF